VLVCEITEAADPPGATLAPPLQAATATANIEVAAIDDLTTSYDRSLNRPVSTRDFWTYRSEGNPHCQEMFSEI
jgi:hypothetical protein